MPSWKKFYRIVSLALFMRACLPAQSLGIVEAGQLTIDLNPLLAIQKQQIKISLGARLVEQGTFDLNYTASSNSARATTPLAFNGNPAQIADTMDSQVGASKLFRSGISISPTLQLARNSDNYTQLNPANTSQTGIRVVLPLLRNRGRAVVAAKETSAALEIDAAVYDLNQAASQALASTAVAYWQYLGAVKNLDVYAGSEERGRNFLDNIRALAAADVIPRIEIANATANLASRTATRISAEQAVLEARQQLAIAIGIAGGDMPALGAPADAFPDGTGQPLLAVERDKLREYIDLALSRRADYLAARVREDEARVLLGASRNLVRPQLDAIVNLGYSGLKEGGRPDRFLSTVFQNLHGPNTTLGFEYKFPHENRFARGQIMESEATLRQQDLRAADLARNIASNAIVAANAINSSVLQLRQAREASASYRAALDGEHERLRQGVGSVLDLLQTEDRYVSATINEINAQVTYSVAISKFRLATGTYLKPNDPAQAVPRAAFYYPVNP